jgi:hypothetical protein
MKIQEYVWGARPAPGGGRRHRVGLGRLPGGAEDPALAAVRDRIERYMTLRPEFGHVVCIGMGHDARRRGDLETKA